MTTATLPRVTTVPDTMAELDRDLAQRAAATLRYSPLKNEVGARGKVRAVWTALLAAGIRPLETRAVKRHMTKVKLRYWAVTALWQLALATSVVLVIWGSAAMGKTTGVLSVLAMLGAIVWSIGAVIVSIALWAERQPVDWDWHEVDLNGYASPVPEHVLALALQVHELLGLDKQDRYEQNINIRFQVAEFSLHQQEVLDPFLVLRVGAERIYLAAWDEPTFKAQ